MESMIKGYVILASAKFIQDLGARVPPASQAEAKAMAAAVTPTGFVPRAQAGRLWSIVAAAGADEQESYDLLVKCGREVSQYAISTFMKLVLKMLTPRMFAKKFPDFWARDHKGGVIVIETIEDHRLVILFSGIGDFDHISAIAVGFIGTTFEAIGVQELEVPRTNWSLAAPRPETMRLEVRWK